jgi:hypothetical protein
MYLRGETQAEIARFLSETYYSDQKPLTQQQISYDIQKLHKLWVRAQLINIDEAKARELARIDRVEREAWAAWERSKLEAQTVTVKTRGTRGGQPTAERTDKSEGQTGDPSYLRIVQQCIEQRCKILGLCSSTLDVTSGGKALNRISVIEIVKDYGPLTPVEDGQEGG